MDPFKEDKRPRFPELVAEVIEEEKENETEPLWKTVVKSSPELKRKIEEKEEEIDSTVFKDKSLDRRLEDLL